jgi:hypothetical protein
LNNNYAANNSILEANDISELDSSKVGANAVLKPGCLIYRRK